MALLVFWLGPIVPRRRRISSSPEDECVYRHNFLWSPEGIVPLQDKWSYRSPRVTFSWVRSGRASIVALRLVKDRKLHLRPWCDDRNINDILKHCYTFSKLKSAAEERPRYLPCGTRGAFPTICNMFHLFQWQILQNTSYIF